MTNEEMFQNIESLTVGLDDTFTFHCTQCGKCCIHRTDIILSPRDIFKMAKELNLSNADFLRKYCSMHIGPTSRIPVIMLRPVGKDDRCPLLKNNKCSVHKVIPSVCGMFPLGRYIAFGKDDFGKKKLDCGEVKYLLQPIECGDKSETHTVREWFGDFDISLEDTAFVHWNQALSVIGMKLKELGLSSSGTKGDLISRLSQYYSAKSEETSVKEEKKEEVTEKAAQDASSSGRERLIS